MENMYRISYKTSPGYYSVRFNESEFKDTLEDAIWTYRCHTSNGQPTSIFKWCDESDDYVELDREIMFKINFLCRAHKMSLKEIANTVEKEIM